VYFIDYWDEDRNKRVREVVGTRKADAEKRAAQIYKDMMSQYLGEPSRKIAELSLHDLVETFFRSKEGRVAPGTVRRYRYHAKDLMEFVAKHFPSVEHVRGIRKIYIEELLEALRKSQREPKTLNALLQFVKALFNFAMQEGYVTENPAQRIKPFREPKQAQAVPFWSVDEVRLILENVKPAWRDAFEFLYHTGLRKGELMNLTWDDVNLKHDSPTIAIQSKEDWTTKTMKRRVIPLNASAVEIIRRQPRSKRHNYVFSGPGGGQVHRDKIYRELKRVLDALKLEGDVHKWRHTFASHLVMHGVDIATVSKLLGHHSIEMTMKYAHLAPDHLQAAVNQLATAIRAKDNSTPS